MHVKIWHNKKLNYFFFDFQFENWKIFKINLKEYVLKHGRLLWATIEIYVYYWHLMVGCRENRCKWKIRHSKDNWVRIPQIDAPKIFCLNRPKLLTFRKPFRKQIFLRKKKFKNIDFCKSYAKSKFVILLDFLRKHIFLATITSYCVGRF